MSEPITSAERKRQVQANFDSIAAHYDALGFVQVCAARLLARANLAPGTRVLDLATGTGLVAAAAAQLVGPSGAVVGLDLAPEMLAQARHKLVAAGLANVTFQVGDMEQLPFPDQSFDLALCASSLFFVPDMAAALREAWRVLVPGGRLGFTSFGASLMHPLAALWANRLRQHGIVPPVPPTLRLADPQLCAQLLREAGFADVAVESEQLGYFLATTAARWVELAASLEGLPLARMTAAQRAQIEAEHLAELDALVTAQGIWVDVPANLAFGQRPSQG